MGLPIVPRHHDGQLQGIICLEEHPIETIGDVKLGEVDGPLPSWISMVEQPHYLGQCPATLHHITGQVWDGVVVDAKLGVVDYHMQLSVVLNLDSHGGQVEILVEGMDLL